MSVTTVTDTTETTNTPSIPVTATTSSMSATTVTGTTEITTTGQPFISGLLLEPSSDEASFNSTDDECPEFVELDYDLEFQGVFFSKLYICTNGLIAFNKPYGGFSVPAAGKELANAGFSSRYLLLPFFTDISTLVVGNIYYRKIDTIANGSLASDIDVITVDEAVRSSQNLSDYKSDLVIKVTWDRVGRYGGETSETSRFQLVLSYNGEDTYMFFSYDANEMNFRFGEVFVGYVANGTVVRKSNSENGSFLRSADTNIAENGRLGFASYKISTGTAGENYKHTCLNWIKSETPYREEYVTALENMPQCPCASRFLFFDRRFLFVPWWTLSTSTFTTSVFPRRTDLPYGKTCAFDTRTGSFIESGNDAGTFNKWNQLWFPRRHSLEDEAYRSICCDLAGLCNQYHYVRPTHSCYTRPELALCRGFGDPHIQTLDKKTYTFNGLGEYVMLDIPSAEFQLQCRTQRAVVSDNSLADATVYSAFAVREGTEYNTLLQVELNDAKDGIYVYVEDRDISIEYNSSVNYTKITPSIQVMKLDGTLQATFAESGVTLNITAEVGMLKIATAVPTQYKGMTFGLLGNYNDNPDDDFVPRGETVPLPSNLTERQIFDFGSTWTALQNETIFLYRNGITHTDYVIDSIYFVPKFLSDVNETLIAKAHVVCNGTGDQQCIYDYAVTLDTAVAVNTQEIQIQAEANDLEIANAAPIISAVSGLDRLDGEYILYLEVNQEVTFALNGTDDGSFSYRLDSSIPNITITETEGNADITVNLLNMDPQSLGIYVVDSRNLEAGINVVMIVCSGCNGHGSCNYTDIRTITGTNDNFRYATCICEPYWDGDDCELDYDACSVSPCSAGTNCTDRPAAEQEAYPNLTAYTCSQCPTGYQDNGTKCEDINECTNSSICSQNCINTYGSYYCTCEAGYRLSGTSDCKDINECDEQISDCLQICTNTEGGYVCSCYPGYLFDSVTNTCIQDTSPNPCLSIDCSKAAGCTINSSGDATCFCHSGFDLLSDNSCTNRNECDLPVCSQTCIDTEGSYSCGCHQGYQLSSDKTTCTECQFPFYGDNCGSTCTCGRGSSSCDSVKGCVCMEGWQGTDCDTDINECLEINRCGDKYKICVNSIGSYTCNCISGYTLTNDGTCIDVNECDSVTLNVCEQDCTNTEGGFVCSCNSGYVVNTTDSTKCTVFDQCAAGTSGCEQSCIHSGEGFSCDCNLGFTLNDDRKTCRRVFNPCEVYTGINCSDICLVVNDVPMCFCGEGYMLGADNQTCIDINECDASLNLNQCSEPDTCLNTYGGFICSCSEGYELSNDERTCTVCDDFHYGVNCANECNCGVGAIKCDPVTGCICDVGWTGTQCNIDVDECGTATSPCTGNNTVCVNNPGSYVCDCQTGYKRNGLNECANIDECISDSLNNCSQVCTDTDGGYTCSCNVGFTADGNLCYDINECVENNVCSQECLNTLGSFKCSCQTGFRLDSLDLKTCIPENVCGSTQASICGANANCAIINDNATCICRSGFQEDPNDASSCIDIQECSQIANPCSQLCVEAEGSYSCICNETGYQLDFDQKTCIACPDGFWGDNCTQTCNCATANTASCDSISGSCSCLDGWGGGICTVDLDECTNAAIHMCPTNSTCENTPGSYYCQCNAGFLKTGNGMCKECDSTHYGINCAETCPCITANTQSCDNVDGSCTCLQGWNGTTCDIDVDECSTNPDVCGDSLKECNNKNGSYECTCITGYRLYANLECIDVNECLEGTDDCLQECINTPGSYHCSCLPGFLGFGNICEACPSNTFGYNCTGTCNCTTEHTSNSTQTCDLVTGFCNCLDSWTGSLCESDVDECTTGTHDCTTRSFTACNNIDGGFECLCVAGYQKNLQETCELCSSNTYGMNCSQTCDCVTAHSNDATQTCNVTDGTCDCLATWTGTRCELDVNECEEGTHGCESEPNQGCHNTNGSFECSCLLDYTRDTAGNCVLNTTVPTVVTPLATQRAINIYLVLDYIVPVYEDLSVTATNQYYKTELERTLLSYYRLEMGANMISVIITSITSGSLVVNHTNIVANTTQSAQQFAASIVSLANRTTLDVFGTSTNIEGFAIENIQVDLVTYSPSSLACQAFLEVISQCNNGYQCQVDSGIPSCQLIPDADNFYLIIGLGIGIPVFFLTILIVAIIFIYAQKVRKRQQRHTSEEPDRLSYTQGFFPSRLPTRINTRGPIGPFSGPHSWEEESSRSASTDEIIRHHRRRDFEDILPEPPEFETGVASNFSWDFMYNYLGPNDRYQIKRPQHEEEPNPLFAEN